MIEIIAETKKGEMLVIRKDKTHHRAYDKDGNQVGPDRIHLESLLEALDASMVGEQNTPDAPEGYPPVSHLAAINEAIATLELDIKHVARKKCCAATANSLMEQVKKVRDAYIPKISEGAVAGPDLTTGEDAKQAETPEQMHEELAAEVKPGGEAGADATSDAPDKQGPDEPEQD